MTATSVAVGGVPAAGLAEPTRAAARPGPITVEATGRGESPKEARKEAIVAALRKVVGEYVEADVEIADDEVVRNEILSFSNAGGVKSEQVGEPRVVGDFVEVTMRSGSKTCRETEDFAEASVNIDARRPSPAFC